ncbi:MAG TPA: class I SAM-dependent methyltransferase, partial [Phenylobacterium sp.]|nr:class I SAM-dependent methyltransferase [Phenylobacterium sp.]
MSSACLGALDGAIAEFRSRMKQSFIYFDPGDEEEAHLPVVARQARERGHNQIEVTAVDQSTVGLAKARLLAEKNGVRITTVTADLNDYIIQPAAWDLIIDFFCHMPSAERAPLHQRIIAGLKPGGAYIYEVFAPAQLELATGGPTTRDLVVSLDEARVELAS